VVASTMALTEIRYRILRKYDEQAADEAIALIENQSNVTVIPVIREIALEAADLRNKYYSRADLDLSYADTVHLATALQTNCKTFITGDPDFKKIKEDIKVQVV
ncbi:MAG: PIN domain-containing protein, partial [Candidatus Altiarchaeota archaeon]